MNVPSRAGKLRPATAALLPALAVALGIALLWGVAVPRAQEQARERQQVWASWDFRTYFLPKFVYGSHELLAGRLPLWNPYERAGTPLLAGMQPAALYPPKVLAFALPDAASATRIFLISHQALLAAGFLWFARGRGIGLLGAFAGAALWTFNFGILLSNYHPNRIACLAWIPIVLALADRTAAGSRAAPFGLAIAVCTLLLAGYPVFASDTALLLGVVAAASWATGAWRARPLETAPRLGAAFLAGGLLAACQWLPALEVLEVSDRAALAVRSASEVARFLDPSDLLVSASGVPLLVGLGLAGLRRRESIPPLAGCLFALLLLLGGWKLLRELPWLGPAIRHPVTWGFVVQLPLAWWLAVGVDALASPRSAGERRLGTAVLGGVGAAAALACALHWLGPESLWPAPGPTRPTLHRVLGPVGELGLAGSLSLVAAGSLLFAAARAGAARHAALALGLAAAAAGQIAGFPFCAPQDDFDHPGLALRTRNLGLPPDASGGRVLSLPDLLFGWSARDRIENLLGEESSLPPPRFSALEERLGVDRARQRLDWEVLAGAPGLLDALDVSAVLAPAALRTRLEQAGLRDTGRGARGLSLYANPDRPGRAFAVYGVRLVAGAQPALDRLLAPDFDPRREAVVEVPLRGAYPARSPHPPTPAALRRPSPTRTEIEVALPRPGILVLADACYPGWRARADARPVETFCANFAMRGVELEAGVHHVVFEYRPQGVGLGLAVSGAAAAVLAVAALWTWRRGRPR
jgi:hypothetical protein